MSLGDFLEQNDLTDLRLVGPELTLARSWGPVDWSRFNQDFDTDTLPCPSPRTIENAEARRMVPEALLAPIERLMREGRHQMMTLKVEPRLGMRGALFVHSSRLGRNNGLHAIRAGGFRRHDPSEAELEVFTDGMNLGRAMSYKNAAADLPLGGCKMTVQSAPVALDDMTRIGFLAYLIESGRFLTGPDMGFLPEHADVMRARFTRHVTGGRTGVLGPTGTPTALGCFLAIREAAKEVIGDLHGKTAAIQGLGAVGFPLAQHLCEAGMKLFVADPDGDAVAKTRRLCERVEVVSPAEILYVDCDLLAPCAFGNLLNEETIQKLNCKMVFGSANNPLAATSTEEELRLSKLLADRNILFAIEWTHNTAGVMSGFEEYAHGDEARAENLRPRLEKVCQHNLRRILDEANRTGRTPTEVAYAQTEAMIFGSAP